MEKRGDSSYQRVKRFLEKMAGRTPSKEEIGTIAFDLQLLVKRLEKIRSSYPFLKEVDFSEDVYRLLNVVNIKVHPAKRKIPFGKAASFL